MNKNNLMKILTDKRTLQVGAVLLFGLSKLFDMLDGIAAEEQVREIVREEIRLERNDRNRN